MGRHRQRETAATETDRGVEALFQREQCAPAAVLITQQIAAQAVVAAKRRATLWQIHADAPDAAAAKGRQSAAAAQQACGRSCLHRHDGVTPHVLPGLPARPACSLHRHHRSIYCRTARSRASPSSRCCARASASAALCWRCQYDGVSRRPCRSPSRMPCAASRSALAH